MEDPFAAVDPFANVQEENEPEPELFVSVVEGDGRNDEPAEPLIKPSLFCLLCKISLADERQFEAHNKKYKMIHEKLNFISNCTCTMCGVLCDSAESAQHHCKMLSPPPSPDGGGGGVHLVDLDAKRRAIKAGGSKKRGRPAKEKPETSSQAAKKKTKKGAKKATTAVEDVVDGQPRKKKGTQSYEKDFGRGESVTPKYKCEKCREEFFDRRSFETHQAIEARQSDPEAVFPCRYCKIDIVSYAAYQEHVKTSKAKHSQISNLRSRTCRTCELVFESRLERIAHEKEEHKPEKIENPCPVCQVGPNEEAHILKHKRHYNDIKSVMSKFEFEKKIISDEILYQYHVYRYPDEKSRIDNLIEQREGRRERIRYTCDFCTETFQFLIDYRNHNMEEHQEEFEKATVCGECGLHFDTPRYLSEHVVRKHSLKCPQESCTLTFADESTKRDHIKNMHPIVWKKNKLLYQVEKKVPKGLAKTHRAKIRMQERSKLGLRVSKGKHLKKNAKFKVEQDEDDYSPSGSKKKRIPYKKPPQKFQYVTKQEPDSDEGDSTTTGSSSAPKKRPKRGPYRKTLLKLQAEAARRAALDRRSIRCDICGLTANARQSHFKHHIAGRFQKQTECRPCGGVLFASAAEFHQHNKDARIMHGQLDYDPSLPCDCESCEVKWRRAQRTIVKREPGEEGAEIDEAVPDLAEALSTDRQLVPILRRLGDGDKTCEACDRRFVCLYLLLSHMGAEHCQTVEEEETKVFKEEMVAVKMAGDEFNEDESATI